MDGIDFSVALPTDTDGSTLARVAQHAETLGFRAVRAPDHPGAAPSPFLALAHAAAVTTTLRLETYVVNAGLRDPLPLAHDTATLDVLSGGRVTLGIGAGHTPAEWAMQGRVRPGPVERIDRLIEVTGATRRLLAGETVTIAGRHVTLTNAHLAEPQPSQQLVPVLVGGSHRRLLEYALATADIVGLSGLGPTLEDGHRHETRWRPADLDRLESVLATRPASVVVDALVQHAAVTDDRDAEAQRLASVIAGATAADVLACPFVLIGTLDQLATEIRGHRERFGITSYGVRAAAMEAVARLQAT